MPDSSMARGVADKSTPLSIVLGLVLAGRLLS